MLTEAAKKTGGSDALDDSMLSGYNDGVKVAADLTDTEPLDTGDNVKQDIADRSDWADASTKANVLSNLRDTLDNIADNAEDLGSVNDDLGDASDDLDFDPDNKEKHGLAGLVWVGATALLLPKLAGGLGYWSQCGDDDVINDWPAQELFRAAEVKEPRPSP